MYVADEKISKRERERDKERKGKNVGSYYVVAKTWLWDVMCKTL